MSCVLLRRVSIICKNISFQIVRDTLLIKDHPYRRREDLRNSLVFYKFIVFQIDKVVRSNFLTLVVQLTISFILSFITQVHTTGTSSDLSRKVWVTAYKGDTY